MNELVSVVVPVYKVEPYLERCIRSIIGQTYENLEIILVDDGSPDQCGAICDRFAQENARINRKHLWYSGVRKIVKLLIKYNLEMVIILVGTLYFRLCTR